MGIQMLNDWLIHWFSNLAQSSDAATSLTVFLASYLPWLMVLVLFLFFWRSRRPANREDLFFVGAAGLLSWVGSLVIKAFYSSPRPFAILADIRLLLPHAADNSFPSSHASFFFALGLALHRCDRRWGTVYLIGAVLISAGRVAAGLHWPTDILGGFVVAALVVAALYILGCLSRRDR